MIAAISVCGTKQEQSNVQTEISVQKDNASYRSRISVNSTHVFTTHRQVLRYGLRYMINLLTTSNAEGKRTVKIDDNEKAT